MESLDLVKQLNERPMWVKLDAQTRSSIYRTIFALSELFQRADTEERRAIAAALDRPAKNLMYDYTRDKAVEGRRTGSRSAIVEGLIPVVMAGGRSDRMTGGSLMAMLCRSAEKTGLDAPEIFAYGAQFATDERSRDQIRDFPSLSPEMKDIARAGFHEKKTPEGPTYEHQTEAMARPRWWDWLLRRRRPNPDDTLATLRAIEEYNKSNKK
ncbi:hypothetical protein SBA4_6360003 [Candidatus Sulfopaludibacter sp. SbA4]|nr:hypothetical protein SBA4_6360003 [Candidatus Sulfopaludibacter sp. SbA4]